MIPRRNNAVPSQQQRHQGRFFRQKYIISVTKLKKVPFFDIFDTIVVRIIFL